MPLGGLQHFTIEPQDLEKTKNFYVDVLGLEIGDRPPLDFPGYWLYSGGQATVHLMGTRKPREGIVVRGTEKKYEDTGRLDHIAFAATDVEGVRKRLQGEERQIPRADRAAHRRHPDLPLRSRWRRRGIEFPEGITRRRQRLQSADPTSAGLGGSLRPADRVFRRCGTLLTRQGHRRAISAARIRSVFLQHWMAT